jgi:hypothetical protein
MKMLPHDRPTYRMYLDAAAAAEQFLLAYASADDEARRFHIEAARKELAAACDKIGFALVPRPAAPATETSEAA